MQLVNPHSEISRTPEIVVVVVVIVVIIIIIMSLLHYFCARNMKSSKFLYIRNL